MNLRLRQFLILALLLAGFYAILVAKYVSQLRQTHNEEQAEVERTGDVKDGKKILKCQTTKGPFEIILNELTAPNSVAELNRMVDSKYFENMPIFRVNNNIIQFGVQPRSVIKYSSTWERDKHLVEERSARKPWERGTFSMIGGPQMVIVKTPNAHMGLNNHDAIAGRVPESDMHIVESFYAYNDIIDNPRGGNGPDQTKVYREGWGYLNSQFPLLDKILKCSMISL